MKAIMGFAEGYQVDLPSYNTLEQEFSTSYTAQYGDKKEPELSELYVLSKGKYELFNQIHKEKAQVIYGAGQLLYICAWIQSQGSAQ